MSRKTALAIALLLVFGSWLAFATPRPILNLMASVEPSVEVGAQLVATAGCRDCHRIDGTGASKGPDLAGVTAKLSEDELRSWLEDPSGGMPNPRLSDTEIDAVILYLVDLDGS